MKPVDHGPVELSRANTLALPSVAEHLYRLDGDCHTVIEQLHHIRQAHPSTEPVILGGGSNVILPDRLPLVLQPVMQGIQYRGVHRNRHRYRVEAATPWHELVCHTVRQGHGGLENLALIPGHCGAAPVQNIGAYGVELARFVHAVEGVELPGLRPFRHTARQAGFGYRTSLYKRQPGRWLITRIELALPLDWQPVLDYPGLRQALGTQAITPEHILRAVVRIRQNKLPDPQQCPNAGSFFQNPTVDADRLGRLLAGHPQLPHWPHEGGYKLSAAWMIEQCGWKGKRLGPVGMSSRHALVLVNHGQARREHVLRLAQAIQQDVHARFGITLQPEPVMPDTG